MSDLNNYTDQIENKKTNSTRKQSKWSSFSSNKRFQLVNPTKKVEKDYIKAYMGKEINQNQFSIPAAILGPFYLLYRKMNRQAFIMILLYIMTYLYLSEEIGILSRLILNIFLGYKTNSYYFQEVERKVETIKRRDKEEELLDLCKKKGKHQSILIIILCFILYITIIVIGRMEVKEEKREKKEYTIYSMKYKVPSSIKIKANHNNYQHLIDEKKGTCSITITGEQTKESEKEYYRNNQIENTTLSQVEESEEIIHKYTWYKVKYKSEKEIYFIKQDDILYKITFDSYQKDSCKQDKNRILKSIEFQKN